jgi:hypothetical protein
MAASRGDGANPSSCQSQWRMIGGTRKFLETKGCLLARAGSCLLSSAAGAFSLFRSGKLSYDVPTCFIIFLIPWFGQHRQLFLEMRQIAGDAVTYGLEVRVVLSPVPHFLEFAICCQTVCQIAEGYHFRVCALGLLAVSHRIPTRQVIQKGDVLLPSMNQFL